MELLSKNLPYPLHLKILSHILMKILIWFVDDPLLFNYYQSCGWVIYASWEPISLQHFIYCLCCCLITKLLISHLLFSWTCKRLFFSSSWSSAICYFPENSNSLFSWGWSLGRSCQYPFIHCYHLIYANCSWFF